MNTREIKLQLWFKPKPAEYNKVVLMLLMPLLPKPHSLNHIFLLGKPDQDILLLKPHQKQKCWPLAVLQTPYVCQFLIVSL